MTLCWLELFAACAITLLASHENNTARSRCALAGILPVVGTTAFLLKYSKRLRRQLEPAA